jgi:hypothetical protein
MTIEETIDVLAGAAAFDRRTVGEADAIAWHATIGDLRFDDCQAAVIAHYRETSDWLMPAHVRQRVRAIRARRIEDAEVPAPPSELADNPPAYSAALHAARVAIADGADPRPAVDLVARRTRRELGAS